MKEFIKVATGGSHREMGVDFGRAAADLIRELLSESLRYYGRSARRGKAFLERYAAQRFLPHVRRRYPDYLEEIEGIAEGAKVPFKDVFLLTADEELDEILGDHEHCSSAAVRTARGFRLLHNEDYPPRYMGRLVIVSAEPDDGPAFLCLTYPYILAGPSCGMNGLGLAFAVDSLRFRPRRAGIPTNYILRDLYRARSLADVRRIASAGPAVMGNAVTAISSRERRAVCIETSPAGKTAVLAMERSGLLAHTNHVRSQKLDRKGERPFFGSRVRLAALEHLLGGDPRRLGLGDLENALSDRGRGLLRTSRSPSDSGTLASAVLDPRKGIMYVAKRGPDGHGFKEYRL